MERYGYALEELFPIVADMAARYTSYESSSISYERAERLMEAVLYCINEYQQQSTTLPEIQKLPAREAYLLGYEAVMEKVHRMKELYHGILEDFSSFKNVFLENVVLKEIPDFLRRYDAVYDPQNTWITFDYPILADISGLSGIDAVYEYVRCIALEQRFLRALEPDRAERLLCAHCPGYETIPENLCMILLQAVFEHSMEGQNADEARDELDKRLRQTIREMIGQYYRGDGELESYLEMVVSDLAVRVSPVRQKTKTMEEADEG